MKSCGGSASASLLASRLDLNEDALDRLLHACVSLQLLHKTVDNEFQLTELASIYLTSSSDKNLCGYIKHSQEILYKLWSGLPSSIKTGQNAWQTTFGFSGSEIFEHHYKELESRKRFIDGMHRSAQKQKNDSKISIDFVLVFRF